MNRPGMDEVLLDVARLMAARGTCSRAQVGAVFALEGRVLATGYNGAPSGLAHCVHVTDPSWDQGKYDEAVAGGMPRLPGDRPGDPGCVLAVHAEANAVAFAAKHGVALASATLYTTLSPCLACAQLLVNVGARRVVADQAYRRVDGLELLHSAKVLVEVGGSRWKPVKA